MTPTPKPEDVEHVARALCALNHRYSIWRDKPPSEYVDAHWGSCSEDALVAIKTYLTTPPDGYAEGVWRPMDSAPRDGAEL